MDRPNATVAVIGAGDYIGGAVAKRFAAGGFHIHAGRRNGDQLKALTDEITAAGGHVTGRSLDARKEDDVAAFLKEADAIAPLEVCVFNIGGNVKTPLLDTTERVFRKVWEMACYAGFLTGREAARHMLPRGKGSIFFTGATASLRGGNGYAAFASAKFGLRAVAQSMARELGAAEHPRRPSRSSMLASIPPGCASAWASPRRPAARHADEPAFDRRDLLAASPSAARRLDFRARPAPLRRDAGSHDRRLNFISISAARTPIWAILSFPGSSGAPGRASSMCRCCWAASSS